MTAPAALHRIAYEATVDDAVEVATRLSRKSAALQKQIRAMRVGTGILGGVALTALLVFYYQRPPRTVAGIVMGVAAGVVFGIVFARLFQRSFDKDTRKRQRKIVAEQFHGKPTVACELELREDAVWVRQAGMEMTFPWRLCTGVLDNAEDVEIDFTAGMCVVPNRHFAAPAERQRFLDASQRLAGAASGERRNDPGNIGS